MINLLPPSEKQNLLAEKQWKAVLIFGVVFFIFFASLILVLISINFSISIQLKAQNTILDNRKEGSETSEIQSIKKEINAANRDLIGISDFYKKKIGMTEFLEKVSALMPEGIYLDGISMDPSGKDVNSFNVSLSGRAALVENVIELNERLKKEKEFSQIYFPPNTWFEKQNFIFNAAFLAVLQNDIQE